MCMHVLVCMCVSTCTVINLVEAHCYGIGMSGQIVEQPRSSEKQIECRCFDREGLCIVTDEDFRG